MNVKILFLATGNIEEIKINASLWWKLHQKQKYYPFDSKFYDLLNKYNLRPTIFNLNCLFELRGIILTDAQILKIKEMKGGINNNGS